MRETQVLSERTPDGVDKVGRYNWSRRNAPGELKYVQKVLLNVDHAYQRQLNDAKRIRIAQRWNWAACGVIIVARRGDGSLVVIDGQHRVAAAMSRSDVQELPCVIFELAEGVKEEATDFLIANKERKPLTGYDSFKALVVSGDVAAIQVDALLREAGREATSHGTGGPRVVKCLKALHKCATTDYVALHRIWPVIAELCKDTAIDNRLVLGMFTLERRLVDSANVPHSMSEPRLKSKLMEAGITSIMRAIGDAGSYYARGGDVVFARGILNVINYRRTNRLVLRGDNGA